MKTLDRVAGLGVALALWGGEAGAETPRCDLAGVQGETRVVAALSQRAVEAIRLAASDGANARLSLLVAPSAPFSLGAGDVGRPLGNGPDGARALARTMKADRFSYLGWDYMDGAGDGCMERKVEVNFIDTAGGWTSRVEFSFKDGRVVSASGWQRTFVSGSMSGVR